MRIVQIEEFFHANAGYQVNILSKYFANKGHEVFDVVADMKHQPDSLTLFFGKDNIEESDKEYEEKNNVKIIRVPTKAYISGRTVFDKSIFKIVDDLNPDILFVHGTDTLIGMYFIFKAGHKKYPIVFDCHMLAMASKNKLASLYRKIYKFFISPTVRRKNLTIIRTQEDDYLEKHLGIPLSQAPLISFGSDTLLFHPNMDIRKKIRKEIGISENDFVIVFTGKLVESKGAGLLADALQKKFNTDKNVAAIIVGSTSGEYGERIEEVFASSENNVVRIPTQRYEDLARYYQAADICVFAKQCSLSFYDAQACALPVVSEDNHINVERCSNNNGLCFKSDDVDDFRAKIEEFINMGKDEFEKYKKASFDYVKENFDYDNKADEYLSIFREAIDNY